jgi:hypothetical protein
VAISTASQILPAERSVCRSLSCPAKAATIEGPAGGPLTPAAMERFFDRFAAPRAAASVTDAFRTIGAEAGMEILGPCSERGHRARLQREVEGRHPVAPDRCQGAVVEQ